MENIIQFLIDESRRYLRAKNSHNLTLKKNTGFPHRRSQRQKERHGRSTETLLTPWRRWVPVLQGGSSGRRKWRRQRGAPSTSTARRGSSNFAAYLYCRGCAGGGSNARLRHGAPSTSTTRCGSSATLPPIFTARGVRVDPRRWRAAGRAPLLPRQQSQLRVEQ